MMDNEELDCLLRDIESILNENGNKFFHEFLSSKDKEIANLQSQLDRANEKLERAIVSKFNIGQNVWSIINDKIGEANITKITAVEGSFREENTINYSITDSYGYALRLPEEQLFATLEEAQAKLQELRGGEWENTTT